MNNRDSSIDIFKGLLVIGMIFCHIILLFTNSDQFAFPRYLTLFINCITFSGFVFCFGYAYKVAYLTKGFKNVYRRILSNTAKTYLAYVLSGLFYKLLIEKMEFTLGNFIKIATFQIVPPLSEFLITFSLFSLFTLVAFKPLKMLLANKVVFLIVNIVFLLTTYIPPDFASTNQIGLIIGTYRFASFPLFQYMPLFLLGLYFAEYKIVFNIKFFIGSIICTIIPFLYYINTHVSPMRFPPSILWIIAPMFFLYCVYLLSKHINFKALSFIGRNVLYFLLMSNIMIFSLRGATSFTLYPDPTAIKSLGAAIVLIAFITYMTQINSKYNYREKQ